MKNLDKMTFSTMFLRECTFFDKIWELEHCVFERTDVFSTKYGHESSYFFLKNQKKGHPVDFLAKNVEEL